MILYKLSVLAEEDGINENVYVFSREKKDMLDFVDGVDFLRLFGRRIEPLPRGDVYLKIGGIVNGGSDFVSLPVSTDFMVHVDTSSNSPSMAFFRKLQQNPESFGGFYSLIRSGKVITRTYVCPNLLGEIRRFDLDKYLARIARA
ncbi:hypothetical protein COU59_02735 [Candidatus Pacearchaeota archaeon CG10_big_fil_rev_8_21_14_0_10_34_12]|nr:MAG: hypothetical protein COU59_02735 [Candidatus Pacearchaeota archaeon CG10_big_fil_rev_8_21_14_0_10_34_12]